MSSRLRPAATGAVDPEDAGVASALVNTMQQVGGSIGVALLSTFSATGRDELRDFTRWSDGEHGCGRRRARLHDGVLVVGRDLLLRRGL